MNPLVILTFVATACSAAPSFLAGTNGLLVGDASGLIGAGYTAKGGIIAPAGYLAEGAIAAAPIAAAPVAAVPAPAPYSTSAVVGAPVTTIEQAPAQISKEVHLGQTTYVSGYATEVLKPAIPDLQIAVPTALKGSTQVNPAIVHVEKEIHTVNEPYEVPKPYDVPYDVIKPVEQIVEVPTPVHVAKPVPYAVPTPVEGEPIIQRVVGEPIIRHNHIETVAQPLVATQAVYAQAAPAAYAQAAPIAFANAELAAPAAYAQAAPIAIANAELAAPAAYAQAAPIAIANAELAAPAGFTQYAAPATFNAELAVPYAQA
jgi:hypothetical protein